MPSYVYILHSQKDGSYSIGHTANLEERLRRHNEGRSKYPQSRVPRKLVYHEILDSKSGASKRERNIKDKKSRDYILHRVGMSRSGLGKVTPFNQEMNC